MHYQIKITLRGIRPPIWRRVLVPSKFTLFELHGVIQIAMGWEDCHLHDFTISRRRYALPSGDDFDEPIDEERTRLGEVIGAGSKFVYQYDFGDSWEHAVVVEKITDDVEIDSPLCVGGARACPPEDSGGAWGYFEKLEALANPDDDEENGYLREWMGDFDPERFDKDSVNKELKRAFRPARRKKTRPAGH
jgi:pRiA4b ORF-3-like protein